MVLLLANYCSRQKRIPRQEQSGLTLIEVLIALAIVGIAMTAIIKASSQSIRSTTYLQEKTVALWVGQQTLNEVRVGLVKLTGTAEVKNEVEMLGQAWYTQINQEETKNKHILKITAKVFNKEIESDDDAPLIVLETYRYV